MPETRGSPYEVFAARSDVGRFGEWSLGLKSARVLRTPDADAPEGLAVGSALEFVLGAAGLTHRVESAVIAIQPPRLTSWRYTRGAAGEGGWLVERTG